jgi:hypothetical protein
MGASAYLGEIGIAVDHLIGMQGPTLGSYNNARSISLMGNASFEVNGLSDFDPVSGLGRAGAFINNIFGAGMNADFAVDIQGGARHMSPDPNKPDGRFWIDQANRILNGKAKQ